MTLLHYLADKIKSLIKECSRIQAQEPYLLNGKLRFRDRRLGYHSVYGGCQRFKRVKYQENGKTTWYEVPLGYYLTHQFKFDLPFGLYKLFPSYK